MAITDHPTLDATLEAVASPLDALAVSFFLAITAPGDDQVKLALRQGAIISAHLDSPGQIKAAKEQAVELVRRFGSEFLPKGGE